MPQDFKVAVSPAEVCQEIIYLCIKSNYYANNRKKRYRSSATIIWALILTFSVTSTVILGLQDNLNPATSVALILTALITLLNGFEPYFNWRSRWVVSEAAQHEFYRLEDDLRILLASTTKEDLSMERIKPYYDRYCAAWSDYGRQWMEGRRNSKA